MISKHINLSQYKQNTAKFCSFVMKLEWMPKRVGFTNRQVSHNDKYE